MLAFIFSCEDLRPAHRLLCVPSVSCTQLEQELPKKLGAVAAIHALVDAVGMQLEAAKSTMAAHLNSTLESSTNITLLRQVEYVDLGRNTNTASERQSLPCISSIFGTLLGPKHPNSARKVLGLGVTHQNILGKCILWTMFVGMLCTKVCSMKDALILKNRY